MDSFSSGGGSFRGGRGGFGCGGRGGRGGRGRGRGRGGGRGGRGRGNFGFQQHRSHEDAGYTEGYAPPTAAYPQPPQQFRDYNQGYAPAPQQGYAPLPQQDQFQPQYQQQYQPPPSQDQYQQPPQYPPQGYANKNQGGYTNGNPAQIMGRYQPVDNFQTQEPAPTIYQQYQQPPPPQYQPPPPPQQYQQFQDESTRYAANPPLPPPQAPVGYADAARARQQAYAPVRSEDNAPEEPPSPYQQPTQLPPPQYQQQQPPQPPPPQYPQQPLPPPPTPQGDWNYPLQEQQWQQQQQSPQPHFVGQPTGYAPQGTNAGPPMQQRHFKRDQKPRFEDRRQNRHDQHHQKQHRPIPQVPSTYICHNCNQPGHWKQHCPLFANKNDNRFGARQEEPFQQRYGPGSDNQWGSAPPAQGNKPHDSRREPYPTTPMEEIENSEFPGKNYPKSQPPLPGGPVPPLPPNSQPPIPYGNDGCAQQQPQPGRQVWKCETCVKSFFLVSQYEAHIGTHVKCTDCDFSSSKRVVTAHYQTAHGQYVGQGLKEIDVEGQKFMVLLGNSVEDITKWREERRKKWLAMSFQPKPPTVTPTGKRKLSVSSDDLEDGEIEEDEEAKAKIALKNAVRKLATSEAGASEASRADAHEPPAKRQRKTMLCKWFTRGHCRFDEAHCKYSHDRSAFGCRALMYKGSCSKGMYCPFSHDTTVLSGQRERSQKASKERATEQQWRGEQKSLLRKLLAKDVRVEQRKMLQIVHFLVANDFLRSPNGEKADVSAQEPAVKIEVLKSDEMSTAGTAEASEPIESVSTDIVMEEASDETEQASTGGPKSATPAQDMESDRVVTEDDNVVPVVEASACGQESQGVSESPEKEVVAPSRDDESEATMKGGQGESVKDASSSAQDSQCHAKAAITDEVIAAVPSDGTELVEAAAPVSGEEPVKKYLQAARPI